MKRPILIFLALCALAIGCKDDDTTSPALSEADKLFISSAADEALFQVNAGQLAEANAHTAAIRKYGEAMTDDHAKANQSLQPLAAARKIAMPTTLSSDLQQKLDSLAMRTDSTFDSLYVDHMLRSHNRGVRIMEIESTAGSDVQLKTWASERLPVLRQFADRAKALADSIN